MSGNKQLIDNFATSQETRKLAHQLFNLAKLNTGEGSGHAVGEFTTGLPAACVLLAVERLNTGEVTHKTAQVASCLRPKDFKRVYESIKAAVEQAERATRITYQDLHKKYKLESFAEFLAPWIAETENALLTRGYQDDQTTRCAVYFWVCNAIKPKSLPETAAYSKAHELSFKSFVVLLELLNQQESEMRKNIQVAFKVNYKSPRKGTIVPQAVQTPARMLPGNADTAEQETPRRSNRFNTTIATLQVTTPSSSPRKRQIEHSPTKVAQPTPLRLLHGRKGPIRELPSKDTPKKHPIETPDIGDNMDVDEAVPPQTPKKRRRIEDIQPSVPITQPPVTPSRPISRSPTKKKAQTIPLNSLPEPARPSSRKADNIVKDIPTSEDESEIEEPVIRRRFRPVYLEHKQWYARDQRLERIWKKASNTPSHS